jgi:hypothetical protein
VAVAIASGQAARERQVPVNQLVSGGGIVRATTPQLVIR